MFLGVLPRPCAQGEEAVTLPWVPKGPPGGAEQSPGGCGLWGGGCQYQQLSVSDLPSLPVTQSPPKGVTIPYRPKPSSSPVIFAGGQVRPLLCSWGVGRGGLGDVLSCERASAAPRACHPRCALRPPEPAPAVPAEGWQQGKGLIWEERVLENTPGIKQQKKKKKHLPVWWWQVGV